MSRESRIINKLSPKPLGNNNFVLPNTSGDHVRGTKRAAPVDDKDLVNKEYVDDKLELEYVPYIGANKDVNLGSRVLTIKNLTITDPIVPWKITKSLINAVGNTELAFQPQTFGAATRIGIYPSPGAEGGENVFLHIYGHGDPTDRTGEFRLDLGWNTVNQIWQWFVSKNMKFQNDAGDIYTIDNTTGDINFGTGNIRITNINKEIGQVKCKMTSVGGFAILLTNNTGVDSVKGELVMASDSNSNSVDNSETNSVNSIGVFLDSGIEDDEDAWIVVSGIAEVKADGTGWEFGDRIVSSVTPKRAVSNNAPSVAVHFQEIGHAIETAGANATAKCVLHFN